MARLDELEAFGETCPKAEEVIILLKDLGVDLVLEMGPSQFSHYQNIPPLPAQYHFQDQHNTEVIYLAGEDHAEQYAPRLPTHASRWWLTAGSSDDAYDRVAKALATQWGLCWQRPGIRQALETQRAS